MVPSRVFIVLLLQVGIRLGDDMDQQLYCVSSAVLYLLSWAS